MQDDDNVWLWTLGGPALMGLAVWSAVVFANDIRSTLPTVTDAAEPAPSLDIQEDACTTVRTAYTCGVAELPTLASRP